MYGNKLSSQVIETYEVCSHVSAAYPPCYILNCLDESMVPPENGSILKDALCRAGVNCFLEQGEQGSHGFGDGRGTSVEGWIDRAAAFAESL